MQYINTKFKEVIFQLCDWIPPKFPWNRRRGIALQSANRTWIGPTEPDVRWMLSEVEFRKNWPLNTNGR